METKANDAIPEYELLPADTAENLALVPPVAASAADQPGHPTVPRTEG
ncbi:hypothetical protein ACFQ7J_11740 [Streptomyces sp. NPDC056501]